MEISMIICSLGAVLVWVLSILWRQKKEIHTLNSQIPWYSYKHPFRGQLYELGQEMDRKLTNRLGELTQLRIKASIAEKTADRAFNLASSATLGVVALQKSLATPRIVNREQSKLNQLAKNSVDQLFTTQGEYDWLKPLLSDSDLDIVEEIERKKAAEQLKDSSQ